MYEAIVFLPLFGAVIAGLITLAGARNRHPGEDPPPPHDDHAAPLVPEHHSRGGPAPQSAHADDHPSLEEDDTAAPLPARGRRS